MKDFLWIKAESKGILEVSHRESGEVQVKSVGVFFMSICWVEGYLHCLRIRLLIFGKVRGRHHSGCVDLAQQRSRYRARR